MDKPSPSDTFTAIDKRTRLTRGLIADLLGLPEDDQRLTDEVCYAYVNTYANLDGDEEVTLDEMHQEFPELAV